MSWFMTCSENPTTTEMIIWILDNCKGKVEIQPGTLYDNDGDSSLCLDYLFESNDELEMFRKKWQ